MVSGFGDLWEPLSMVLNIPKYYETQEIIWEQLSPNMNFVAVQVGDLPTLKIEKGRGHSN